MAGWERLQGNAFIKEGEAKLIRNKQASASRRKKAPLSQIGQRELKKVGKQAGHNGMEGLKLAADLPAGC